MGNPVELVAYFQTSIPEPRMTIERNVVSLIEAGTIDESEENLALEALSKHSLGRSLSPGEQALLQRIGMGLKPTINWIMVGVTGTAILAVLWHLFLR